MAIPTVDVLLHALRVSLPALMTSVAQGETKKPVRMVIIDSLSALFVASDKPSGSMLVDRSKSLTTISSIMHTMASEHNIAFVVINAVKDVFFRHTSGGSDASQSTDIIYDQQSRWFNSDSAAPGGHLKEATLGLVWANQLNARIMLTRTNRRRALDEDRPSKRTRTESSYAHVSNPHDGHDAIRNDDSVLLRRFAVLFSSVCEPRSVDFVVTKGGVFGRGEERPKGYPRNETIIPDVTSSTLHDDPSDGPGASDVIPSSLGELDDIGDDDIYWNTFNDFTKDELLSIDFDGLDEANINEDLRVSQAEV